MAIANPRSANLKRIAFARQADFSTAAATSAALVYCQVEAECQIRRGATYIDTTAEATTGSEFPRSSRTEAATAPTASLRVYAASRAALAFLQEFATHGLPTATQAAGDISVTSTLGYLTTVTLSGMSPGVNCTARGQIFAKVEAATPGAGQGRVSLYSDSARTALVAQGSGTYSTTVTLTAQNASGLTGTVALGNAGSTSDLTGTTITVKRLRAARAAQIARWFTLFADTGTAGELETLAGCTVSRLAITSAEDRRAIVEVEIVGAVYSRGSHDSNLALTVAEADLEAISQRGLVLTFNGSANSCWSLRHGIEHDIWAPTHNSATPLCVLKRGSRLLPMTFAQRLADEAATIQTDALAGTFRAVSAVYSRGSRAWSWSYGFALGRDPDIPPYRAGDHANVTHALDAREQNTASPSDPLAIYLDL